MKKLVLFFLIPILPFIIQAQSISEKVTGSMGMVFLSAEGQNLSCTLGEFMVATYASSDYVLTQGFHQLFNNSDSIDLPVNTVLEDQYYLAQNYPNPFRTETFIAFHLPKNAEATLRIFDLLGRSVLHISGSYHKGLHVIQLKDSQFPTNGQYFYHLQSDDFSDSKSMILTH